MSFCKSCGAPILWATTQAGAAIPLDEEPNGDGNIVLEDGVAKVIAGPLEVPAGTEIYMAHFATCPEGREWRKPKKRKATP